MRLRQLSIVLLFVLPSLALAGTVTHSLQEDFVSGSTINVDISNDQIALDTLINEVDGWIRRPYNATDWEVQLEKDDATFFASGDRCLRAADNPALDGPTEIVLNREYRTGQVTKIFNGASVPYVATLSEGTALTLPAGMVNVDQIALLTGGSRIASTNYVATFSYSDGTVSNVLVPVPVDTVLGAARNGAGVGWTRTSFSVVRRANTKWDKDSNGVSDCAGNGADEIVIDNPFPAKSLDEITIDYTHYMNPTAGAGWLGGPLALSIVTTEDQIQSAFTYEGEYASPTQTTSAVDAGAPAIWYEMSWVADGVDLGSEILVHVSCADDDVAVNGLIDADEQSDEQTFSLSQSSAPAPLAPCSGRYLLYRVELIDAMLDTPSLHQISLSYDIDADRDGFGAMGLVTFADCNDLNPAINLAAIELIGDNVDSNCDNLEICYRDVDNDGARALTSVTSMDTDCDDPFEGRIFDPIDCNDTNPSISPLLFEAVGDGLDNNCDGVAL